MLLTDRESTLSAAEWKAPVLEAFLWEADTPG